MNTTLTHRPSSSPLTLRRSAAWAGIAGPVLFVVTFLVLEVVQGTDYDRVSEVVSALEAGPHGWVQQLSFVVFGVLTLVFATGLHRAVAPSRGGVAGPALLALSGVASILAAVFPLREDTLGGTYDPSGHVVAGTMFFATSAVGLVLLSRRLAHDSRWSSLATYVLVVGIAAVAGFVAMGAFVMPDDAALHQYAGLGQRAIVVLLVFPCRVALAVRMLRLAQ